MKNLILMLMLGILPASGYAITCTNSDSLCIRQPGLTPKARVDSNGKAEFDAELELPEQAAPSTPASGRGAVYFKTDGHVYSKNDAGTETQLDGGGAGVALVDTNTWTGSQTFIGLNDNFCRIVDSTDVAEAYAITLADPYLASMSSYTYRVRYAIKPIDVIPTLAMLVNEDAANNYRTAGFTHYSSYYPPDTGEADRYGMWLLWFNTNNYAANSSMMGTIEFSSAYGQSGKLLMATKGVAHDNSTNIVTRNEYTGVYLGSATGSISSISIGASSGGSLTSAVTLTQKFGVHAELYRCGPGW